MNGAVIGNLVVDQIQAGSIGKSGAGQSTVATQARSTGAGQTTLLAGSNLSDAYVSPYEKAAYDALNLSEAKVIGTRSLSYTDGRGNMIMEALQPDGSTLQYYADGYASISPSGQVSSFTQADVSYIGASLSNDQYQFVSDRISYLQSNTDGSPVYHAVAGFFDSLFGIDPNPMRTPAQEMELAGLQGVVGTRVDSMVYPERYSLGLRQIDAAAGGLAGAAAVIATRNSSPTTQNYAIRAAGILDQGLSTAGTARIAQAQLAGIPPSMPRVSSATEFKVTGGLGPAKPSGGLLVELNPSDVRFTQTTVKQQGATLSRLTESLRQNGFVVELQKPIDVVRMPDGRLTSLDNTRILAAQRAGVNVQARIFDYADPLPNDSSYVDRFIGRKGEIPTTYGDAVMNRIGNQSSMFRNSYLYGSPYTGSKF